MTVWAKEQAQLRNAGWDIPDPSESYRPGGYPRLGLAPLGIELSKRSAALLTRQIETAEHKRGNVRFEAKGLAKLDVRLANELASVYLGLASKHHGVWVDSINFSTPLSEIGSAAMAFASETSSSWPTLHALSYEIGSIDVGYVLAAAQHDREIDPQVLLAAEREAQCLGRRSRTLDLQSHGTIELTECFGHPRCYGTLQAYWAMRSQMSAAQGRPVRLVPTHLSEASFILTHEFGHVVDVALQAAGKEAYFHVLEALETAVLRDGGGRWLIKDRALRDAGLTRRDARLINYPTHFAVRGEGEWRRVVRKVVGTTIALQLGSYASWTIDEMFAEAFALMHSARDTELRSRLAGFKKSLVEVGVAQTRRSILH